jgi:hypothetical protein
VVRPPSRRSQRTRWLAYLATVGVAVLATLSLAEPAVANDGPTAMAIAGPGLSEPISLHNVSEPDLFNRLLHQVNWMAGRGGDPMKPDPATLGPKYVVTVLSQDKPVQTYEVYPRAKGGPKAYRPAAQPSGKTSEAWFYVSMSVPELLQAAGVPLTDGSGVDLQYQDPAGYIPAATNTDTRPLLSLKQILNAQRRTLAAWVGSALLVLVLVVLAARRSRRRYA